MFGNLRVRLDFPTYRPKERPLSLKMDVLPHEAAYFAPLYVQVADCPRSLSLFKLSPPGIFEGRPYGDFGRMGPWFCIHKEDAHFFASHRAVSLGPYRHMSFCRMLAKIAHSYSAAEWGREFQEFEHLVTDLIREHDILPYMYVGSDLRVPPAQPQTLHFIRGNTRSFEGYQYLIVTIRLFAFMGAPVYRVVSARRLDSKLSAPSS
jgi:hypothetical protein